MANKRFFPVLLLCLLLFAAVPVFAQDNPLPAPTGPHAVGVEWRHWIDEARAETEGESPSGQREMMVGIWYPAEAEAGAETADYIPNAELVVTTFAELMTGYGLPLTITGDDVAGFAAHAVADAPLAEADAPYPVLVFSHGGAADVTMYTAQLEELASHGYVVVGINHPFGAAAMVLPDGETLIGDYSAGLEAKVPLWSADQIFVMDQMEALNANDPEGRFTGQLDTSGFGVLGHSLGADAVATTCSVDDRCRAGVSEDGIVMDFDQPFLYFPSQANLAMNSASYEALAGPVYVVEMEGFEHVDFGDFVLWPAVAAQFREVGWSGAIEAQRAVELTRAYLVAFFDKYLKGEDNTLLDAPAHPEVTVVSPEQASAPITEEAAQAFAERFDAIFDGPNVAIADELMAEDFVGHLPLAPELDRQGWKDYVASFYVPFPDLTEEMNQVIVSDDRVVVHVTYTGTHQGPFFGIPATGNPVVMEGIGIFRFDENGLAVENWAVIDVVGLLAQIGAFPPSDASASSPAEQASASITEEAAQAFVDRFDAMFDGPNVDIADEIFAPEFISRLPLAPELDREAFKAYVLSFYEAFPDLTQEVYGYHLTDDRLILHVSYHATHTGPFFGIPATGNAVVMDGIGIFEFDENGLAINNWAVLDVVGVLAQIGAFPPSDASAANEAVRQSIIRAGESLESGDYTDLEAFITDSYLVHSPLGELDANGVKAFFDSLRAALTDFDVNRIDVVVEGSMAAARFTIGGLYENPYVAPTGTFEPTGQPVLIELINVFHLNEEGRVVEEWVQFDTFSFLMQMNAMPSAQPAAAADISEAAKMGASQAGTSGDLADQRGVIRLY